MIIYMRQELPRKPSACKVKFPHINFICTTKIYSLKIYQETEAVHSTPLEV